MAWIEKRRLSDGTVAAHVIWRLGGGRAGGHWPDRWRAAPPTFAEVGEESVRQIVDLSPGQHKRYLAQLRVLAATEVRGSLTFATPVTQVAEHDISAWLIDWDRS